MGQFAPILFIMFKALSLEHFNIKCKSYSISNVRVMILGLSCGYIYAGKPFMCN